MENLISRLRQMGILLLIGFLLIIYIAFGFVYLQQAPQQGELDEQIANLSLILSRPLPSAEELQAEYDEVNFALAPMTDIAAVEMLVGIAEESGIDIDEDSGKFHVPSATFSPAEVGKGSYQILPFRNIHVQGNHDNVMAFISDLDSGKTLKTMVLTRVATHQTALEAKAEEQVRREEFLNVAFAVVDMMTDNGLSAIPNPMNFAGGIATNLMGDDSGTVVVVEGFPDITTTAVGKGYTGTDSPWDGYVLYEHDKISTDNTTQFETVSYISIPETEYYYTCEADGTVRQFDGPDVATATEYPSSEWEVRRTEMYNVSLAVIDMMTDNGLSAIPNPMNFAGGIATNLMGYDPDIEETVEGFPDITTTAVHKGYTGTNFPRGGYVLYGHDKISTDNTTQFETARYIIMLTTKYYYTCEADGTVRQFDGPDVATAKEHLKIETVATLDVDIYNKPEE